MDKSPTQHLRPLLLNENWSLFEEYLAEEKNRLVTLLCNCNETQLRDIQGQIRTIEGLLKLKGNLKTEMRSKG